MLKESFTHIQSRTWNKRRGFGDMLSTYLNLQRMVGEDKPEENDGRYWDERLEGDRVKWILKHTKQRND